MFLRRVFGASLVAIAFLLVALSAVAVSAEMGESSIDGTFGDSGYVAIPEVEQIDRIVIDDEGRILASGMIDEDTLGVFRFSADGERDASFGDAGVARIELGAHPYSGSTGSGSSWLGGSGSAFATVSGSSWLSSSRGLAVDETGSVYVTANQSVKATLAKLDASGQLAAGFGTGGSTLVGVGCGNHIVEAHEEAGRVWLFGVDGYGPCRGNSYAVFNADTGIPLFSQLAAVPDTYALGVGETSSGFIVADDWVQASLLFDGVRVDPFGVNGRADLREVIQSYSMLSTDDVDEPRTIDAVGDDSGRFIVGGILGDYLPSELGAVRLLEDGTLDTSFGDDGVARAGFACPLSAPMSAPWVPGLCLIMAALDGATVVTDLAGRVGVAGSSLWGGTLFVAGFDASGNSRPDFGEDGGVIIDGFEVNDGVLAESANGARTRFVLAGSRGGEGALLGLLWHMEEPSVAPRVAKEQVADALNAALPTGDKKADDRIEKALKHLNKALDDDEWIDDSHIGDDKIIKEESKAVKELEKLPEAFEPWASPLIQQLVMADRTLATLAYEAALPTGDPKDLAKAEKAFDKAAEHLANADWHKAIDEYAKAWRDSVKALK